MKIFLDITKLAQKQAASHTDKQEKNTAEGNNFKTQEQQ